MVIHSLDILLSSFTFIFCLLITLPPRYVSLNRTVQSVWFWTSHVNRSICSRLPPSLSVASTTVIQAVDYRCRLLVVIGLPLVAQLVKNLPAMGETWVWSLGWEDPLEKEKATHSSILAWRIHRVYIPWGHKESDMSEWLSLTHSLMLNPWFNLRNATILIGFSQVVLIKNLPVNAGDVRGPVWSLGGEDFPLS